MKSRTVLADHKLPYAHEHAAVGEFVDAVRMLKPTAIIGVAAIARGLTRADPDPIEPHRLEPLFLIFTGIVAFSLLVERAGLLVASAALIGIACYRRIFSHPWEVLITYVALTGFAALVFVVLFEMPMPLFWWR